MLKLGPSSQLTLKYNQTLNGLGNIQNMGFHSFRNCSQNYTKSFITPKKNIEDQNESYFQNQELDNTGSNQL